MARQDCIASLWLVVLILLSIFIVVVSQLGTLGAIIGITVGVLTVIGIGIATRGKISRWWLLRDPIRLTFLIPQCKYPEKQYIGALPWELRPTNLTMGIGRYYLLFIFETKITLATTNSPYIQFRGEEHNKPKMETDYSNPFNVETIHEPDGTLLHKDWWGNIRPRHPQEVGPYYAGSSGSLSRQIQTFGDWNGEILVEFYVKEKERPIEKSLKLKVSSKAEVDQIPFLKI